MAAFADSRSPVRYERYPKAVNATERQCPGSGSSFNARRASSSATETPPRPNIEVRRTMPESSDCAPSGKGPSTEPSLTEATHLSASSTSPTMAEHQAAVKERTGSVAISSSPTAESHERTVSSRPAFKYEYQFAEINSLVARRSPASIAWCTAWET